MTNLEALLAEVEPYTPGSLTLEKALIDVGLDMQENYKDEKLIALAKAAQTPSLVKPGYKLLNCFYF
ncbi:MAG: hypothetical protein ACQPRJ_02475 [Solitalea-like symbiont of Acarus siro]